MFLNKKKLNKANIIIFLFLFDRGFAFLCKFVYDFEQFSCFYQTFVQIKLYFVIYTICEYCKCSVFWL